MSNSNDSPSEWHCDCCGEKVAIEDGNLEWSKGKGFDEPAHDFKIVHRKKECSFRAVTPGDTYAYLSDFVGDEGLFSLIKIMERNASRDPKKDYALEIANLIRRLHVPFWEIARGKLLQYAEANQVHPEDLKSSRIDKLREIAEWEP